MKKLKPPDPRDINHPRPDTHRPALRLTRLLAGRDVLSGGRTGGAYFDESEVQEKRR